MGRATCGVRDRHADGGGADGGDNGQGRQVDGARSRGAGETGGRAEHQEQRGAGGCDQFVGGKQVGIEAMKRSDPEGQRDGSGGKASGDVQNSGGRLLPLESGEGSPGGQYRDWECGNGGELDGLGDKGDLTLAGHAGGGTRRLHQTAYAPHHGAQREADVDKGRAGKPGSAKREHQKQDRDQQTGGVADQVAACGDGAMQFAY